jgi:hypothetical protein
MRALSDPFEGRNRAGARLVLVSSLARKSATGYYDGDSFERPIILDILARGGYPFAQQGTGK